MHFLRRAILISSMLLSYTIGTFMTYIIMVNNSFLLEKELTSSIISGLSSFLGGIVAGIIAFVVARSQFLNERIKEREQKNTKNINLIKALQNETEHNTTVFEMLCSSTKGDYKHEYINLLESKVWENIKYEANDFLPTNLYKLLDDQSREYNDIKLGKLTEYKNIKKIDFKVRHATIKKISSELSKIEKIIKNDKSKKKLI